MNRSESLAKLMPALLAAAAKFGPALRNAENPHFRSKFVDLAGVNTAIDDALLANGLIALQPTRIGEDGRTIVETTIFHASGEFIGGEYPVTASQAGPQGEGSGLTYARRYALMALVGIAPEDDDGNAAQRGQGSSNGHSQAAPKAETAAQVRARVAAVGRARGLSDQEIADDFASWSQGTKIVQADVASLTKYIDHMNSNTAR